jgi:hypothetical protein
MVVVWQKKGGNYALHDPGLPPQPSRKVPKNMLLKAWQYAGKENMALVALKKT